MKALLINPKDADELAFITSLMQKLGIRSTAITEEDWEDMALAKLMKEVDRTKTVSRSTIMKKLASNAS